MDQQYVPNRNAVRQIISCALWFKVKINSLESQLKHAELNNVSK